MDDFLGIPSSQYVAENDLCFAIRDGYPVTPGHTLVITRRKVATWFDATPAEQRALFDLVAQVKVDLDRDLHPDGFNVGFNVREAAGQTVMHLHIHVIPRYLGDMPDPRGGVRHVIPDKGNYKAAGHGQPVSWLSVGGDTDPFWAHIGPLFARATEIAIVAAFVSYSGLRVLEREVEAALARGARLRFITGDYLGITQVAALHLLLDWKAAPGDLDVRVIAVEEEAQRRSQPPRSFHPKSWRFAGPDFGVAYVGSSNVSSAALHSGVEWNLRADRADHPAAYRRIVAEFDRLWQEARTFDEAWVRAYEERISSASQQFWLPEDVGGSSRVPAPHAIQQEALAALARVRTATEEGKQPGDRALVVLATGLGKTWLAVFDVWAFAAQRGVFPRVLFVAHQEHLLRQAAKTFGLMLRETQRRARVTWFVDERSDLGGDIVFASVQKLSRPEHLAKLGARDFSYVIFDEAHHALAASYQRILDHLRPDFLLGLTATPERGDLANVAELFGGDAVYSANLGTGISQRLLTPFVYYGVADRVEYQNIPFRNRKFDLEALLAAVETDARMEQLWRAWSQHPGQRTVIFCVAVRHAQYVRDWLRRQGLRVESVHSQDGSAELEGALAALARRDLDAVCAVDMLNEGIDLPEIDRVIMLRPSESPVVFLQQLGRGLRRAPGKAQLTVIDFVGNHRVFLSRLATLLRTTETQQHTERSLRDFLNRESGAPGNLPLPPGCGVVLELEAQNILRELLPPPGRNAAVALFREQRLLRERRPTAEEFYLLGLGLRLLYPARPLSDYGWFDFLLDEDREAVLLTDQERAVLGREGVLPWLRHLEVTVLTKSYKLVLLRALINAKALRTGLPLSELAALSLKELRRSPALARDMDVDDLRGMDREVPGPRWIAYWNRNPVNAWTGNGQGWFGKEDDRLIPKLPQVPVDEEETFIALTTELIDYRLADYLSRDTFVCDVTREGDEPVLKLSSKRDLPEQEVEVLIGGRHVWTFALHKKGCRSAHPVGGQRNRLPELLRAWFGEDAGRRGERAQVRLDRGERWTAEPIGAKLLQLAMPLPRRLPAYATLRAAAGALAGGEGQDPAALQPELREFPTDAEDAGLFAVQVSGNSMDGGNEPVHDGDWVLMRPVTSGAAESAGKVVLVEVPDQTGDQRYLLKRLVREAGGIILRSENPDWPSTPLPQGARVVAELVGRPHLSI